MEPKNIPVQQQQSTPIAPHANESMWSAFQNILTFISLAFFAGAIHSLWSIFINFWVPTNNSIYSSMGTYLINGSIAALVVSTPFFISLFIITNSKYIKHPDLKNATLKKILNYITLIITFLILLIRTISAINTALSYAFTINFSLNLLVTLVITGVIFGYYLYEVRFEKHTATLTNYIIVAIIISLIAVSTLVVGFYVRSQENQKTPERVNIVKPITQTIASVSPTPKTFDVLAVSSNLSSNTQTVQGIDFSVTDGRIYKLDDIPILELSMVFSANMPCPLTGGAVCGVNRLGIHVVDKDGFKTEQTAVGVDWIQDTILKQGEKIKGKAYFIIQDISDKYFLTYSAPSGKSSKKVEIQFTLK